MSATFLWPLGRYCGLPCMMKKSQVCSSDEHMVCEKEGTAGICAYAS